MAKLTHQAFGKIDRETDFKMRAIWNNPPYHWAVVHSFDPFDQFKIANYECPMLEACYHYF